MGDKIYIVKVLVEEYDLDTEETTSTTIVNDDDGVEFNLRNSAESFAQMIIGLGREIDDSNYADAIRDEMRDEMDRELNAQEADPEDETGWLPENGRYEGEREPAEVENTGFAPAANEPGMERLGGRV